MDVTHLAYPLASLFRVRTIDPRQIMQQKHEKYELQDNQYFEELPCAEILDVIAEPTQLESLSENDEEIVIQKNIKVNTKRQRYICDTCGASVAKNKRIISLHKKIHKPHEWHVCSECSLRTAQLCNLKRHILAKHTPYEERPYGCNRCKDMRYVTYYDLVRHMKSRHHVTLPKKKQKES